MKIETDILGQLMPNPLTMFVQLCATAVLFFLMYKLAYKPVKKIIDARSEFEQNKLSDAEKLKSKYEDLHAQAEKEIVDAKAQAQEIVNKAQDEGNRVKNNLIDEGKQKSQQIVEEAQNNIALQKAKMLNDMHGEIVDVAMSAAEKLLQTKLNSKEDKESIDQFIKEVTNK
ncbi:MAG: F0F1 ATP synthase subunit B [Erysipelotrichaceae bacterium]|nr:F0F1 ATP synthase subunit B [Erysipelotrichaceae bacterium]